MTPVNKSSTPLGSLFRMAAILLCIAAVTLPLLPSRVFADSAGTFGLRPAHPIPELPETASYFVYTIKPGESITDEAIVVNTGATPVRLNIYPADGQTALNGGISYPGKDEPRIGTGNWVRLSESDITLPPGQEQTFGFTVSVPAGTPPKQYVAGIILQNADVQLGSGTVGVNIVQRTATAILINVGGPLSENLEIEGVKANISSPATTKTASAAPDTLTVTMFNDSLSLVIPTEITIDVLDLDGNVTATLTAVGGTILPGDRIQVTTLFPKPPKDGTYSFYAEAVYAKGKKIAVWPKPGTIIAPIDPPKVDATDPGGKPLETLPGRVELVVSPKKEDTHVTIPIVLPLEEP